MDIYDYAKKHKVDYMDANFNIYKVQQYWDAIRKGQPTDGIMVYDINGNFKGVAKKKTTW